MVEAEINTGVDAVSSSTKNKTQNEGRVGGSYHNEDGSSIEGVIYPVRVKDPNSLDSTKKADSAEALFCNASYAWFPLEEAPAAWKVMDNEGGFGAVKGEKNALSGSSVDLKTSSGFGDYQLSVNGLPEGIQTVSGVVLKTKEGASYGLRHLENIWIKSELAFSVGFTTVESHGGNVLSYENYKTLMGQTISEIDYYTTEGIYAISTETYLPIKTESVVTAEDAPASSGETCVTITPGLAADFDAVYAVEGLEGVSVENEKLTWNAESAKPGSYTVTVSDRNGKYADKTAAFNLSTDKMPAAYNDDLAAPALVKAGDADDEEFANYLKNIKSVTVNGSSFGSSGRGWVTIISQDNGSIDTAAASRTGEAVFGRKNEVTVVSTGYPELSFRLDFEGYVLMNIPYDEFYSAELANTVPVDAFTSATKSKPRNSMLAGGSYHVDASGDEITGVIYPVFVSDLALLAEKTKITDESSIDITVTNRGQTSTTTYKGAEALFEAPSYSYYKLDEDPSVYKTLTVEEDGSFAFSKTSASETSVEGSAAILTESRYGDYQINVESDAVDALGSVAGVVLRTEEGSSYGLRHLENIWFKTSLAFCTGFTENVHSCPTSSGHYKAIMGQTITEIAYYTTDGVYVVKTDLYVPVKEGIELTVEDALLTEGSTAMSLSAPLPDDFKAAYAAENLTISADGDTLTFNTDAKPGSYTLTITDDSGKYAPVTANFVLLTSELPVTYNGGSKVDMLEKMEGISEEDFANYLKNIASVTVNGTSYAASGRGSVQLIDPDTGAIDLDAGDGGVFTGDYDALTMALISTGYPDFEFTLRKPLMLEGADAEWTKDSDKELSFRSDAEYKYLRGVLVDGEELTEDAYTSAEGSTVIKLQPSYLETLAAGSHSVIVKSANGKAEAGFTVMSASSSNTDSAGDSDTSDSSTSDSDTSDSSTSDSDTSDSSTSDSSASDSGTSESGTSGSSASESGTSGSSGTSDSSAASSGSSSTSAESSSSRNSVNTGDESNAAMWLMLIAAAAAVLVFAVSRKRGAR